METFKFNLNIAHVMSLIISTVHSNKEIFLIYLNSNTSNALDKIRYETLSNLNCLEEEYKLKMKLIIERKERTMKIRDIDCSMTKEEHKDNLGTMKSGTMPLRQLSARAHVSMSVSLLLDYIPSI